MITNLAFALLLGGPAQAPAGIDWERHFDKALAKAQKLGKPLVVDFWADWCSWCHRLDETTYVDPAVVELSRSFVPVKVDTEAGKKEAEVAARYDVQSLPTIAFLSPSGRLLLRLDGYQGPGHFPRTMQHALKLAEQVMAWEQDLELCAEDANALYKLGSHLYELEVYEESRELLYRARRHDARLPAADRKSVRLLLGVVQYYDKQHKESEGLLKEGLALGHDVELDGKLLYVMGRNYMKWGRHEDARRVLRKVIERHAASSVAEKARETLLALDRR